MWNNINVEKNMGEVNSYSRFCIFSDIKNNSCEINGIISISDKFEQFLENNSKIISDGTEIPFYRKKIKRLEPDSLCLFSTFFSVCEEDDNFFLISNYLIKSFLRKNDFIKRRDTKKSVSEISRSMFYVSKEKIRLFNPFLKENSYNGFFFDKSEIEPDEEERKILAEDNIFKKCKNNYISKNGELFPVEKNNIKFDKIASKWIRPDLLLLNDFSKLPVLKGKYAIIYPNKVMFVSYEMRDYEFNEKNEIRINLLKVKEDVFFFFELL